MALTRLTTDIANISKLDNTPSDDTGYTAAGIKALFDKAGVDIKSFINGTMIPELDTLLSIAGAYGSADVATVINFLSQSRRNLLHNWDFRNPVNQRGQSSYTGIEYTIDKWLWEYAGTMIVNSGYITLSTSALYKTLVQKIDTNVSLLRKKSITISLMTYEGTLFSTTSDIPATGNFVISTDAGSFKIDLYYDSSYYNGYVCYRIYSNTASAAWINIEAVKLEFGSVSTLAYDPPADYGEQLALCQRYLRRLNRYRNIRVSTYTPNALTFDIGSIDMRLYAPSIAISNLTVYNFAGAAQSGFTFEVAAYGSRITAKKIGHGLTDAFLSMDAGDTLLSAEL